ncbi:MAG: IS3 family transposase [Nitrospira sp.]|nr:IS3 family transposase [Nitrospira sp.]
MKAARPDVSERQSCRVLGVSRVGLHRRGALCARQRTVDPPWTERLHQLIQPHPTFGYRRLWVLLRFRDGLVVNRKAVYRIVKQKRWFVHQRSSTPRPRVRGWVSRASRSNERWALDVTHIPCGHDGWAHLAAVNDCHDRELIGYEFALRSRVKEAERAVEAACLQRFGTLRPIGGSRTAKRQWPDLPESAGSTGLSRLSPAAGVHHALYAGTEWDDRTVFSESERRVRLATHVPDL